MNPKMTGVDLQKVTNAKSLVKKDEKWTKTEFFQNDQIFERWEEGDK